MPVLLFYLRMFHSSAECTSASDARHPIAVNVAHLEPALLVSLGAGMIKLNNVPTEAYAQLGSDEQLVARLYDDLLTLRHDQEFLHTAQSTPNKIILAAEPNTPYRLVKRVLEAARLADYTDIEYVVEVPGDFEVPDDPP